MGCFAGYSPAQRRGLEVGKESFSPSILANRIGTFTFTESLLTRLIRSLLMLTSSSRTFAPIFAPLRLLNYKTKVEYLNTGHLGKLLAK